MSNGTSQGLTDLPSARRKLLALKALEKDDGVRSRISILVANLDGLIRDPSDEALRRQTLRNIDAMGH